jgi:hypothetical protein
MNPTALVAHETVVGFDVAVDDPASVDRRDASEELADKADGEFPGRLPCVDEVAQALTADLRHHQEVNGLGSARGIDAEVEHGHHVRVGDLRAQDRLLADPLPLLVRSRVLWQDHLRDHRSSEHPILSGVHDCGATGGDHLPELVATVEDEAAVIRSGV